MKNSLGRVLGKSGIATLMLALFLSMIPQAALAEENPSRYTPYDLSVSQIPEDETHPFGSALLKLKIKDLPGDTGDSTLTWYAGIEKKIGTGEWIEVALIPSAAFLAENQVSDGVFQYEQLWNEDYAWNGTTKISYRTCVKLDDLVENRGGRSGYSNEASLGLQASTWAAPELQKAEALGLIPAILAEADMTRPITREEFCELAVLLYEKVTAQTAQAASPNPFKDTQNVQILKAFRLGITNGISTTTFEPQTLINREQCAAMLFRAIRGIRPGGDYSTAGAKDFADQKHISFWALDAAKYMSGLGIVKGDSNGNFMPKAMTSVQQASGYGMATREAAILMSVRAYEAIN